MFAQIWMRLRWGVANGERTVKYSFSCVNLWTAERFPLKENVENHVGMNVVFLYEVSHTSLDNVLG